MKKTLILAVLVILTTSCKEKTKKLVDYVILSGNISNTKGGELKISSLNGFSKIINIKDTGAFTDTLFIEESSMYNLRFNQLRLTPYLNKGGNITITADMNDPIKSLKFSGDYSNLNNYFAYKIKQEFDFNSNRMTHYNLDEKAFESKIKTIQNNIEKVFDTLSNIPENIKLNEKKSINYNRLSKKISYETMHSYVTKNKEFKASNAFKQELLSLNLNNGNDYLYSTDYQQMVANEIREKSMNYYRKDSLPFQKAQQKALIEIENETIRNAELFKAMPMTLTRSNNKEEDLNIFLNTSTNEKHKANIQDLYKTLKALDPGQPSPKFENYENYAGGTTSLNDLKGKYVYIDVWATWCGPCKYEIPFLQKVEEKYHDKNIHFVSISTDKQKDKDKWKAMIAEKNMGGIQLITDNDFNTPFIQAYKIMGIPRFILLDPKGNIVMSSAHRPSSNDLTKLFDSIL